MGMAWCVNYISVMLGRHFLMSQVGLKDTGVHKALIRNSTIYRCFLTGSSQSVGRWDDSLISIGNRDSKACAAL